VSGVPGPGAGDACLALEVNDVGLVALLAGASRPEPASPGVALLDGARLLVGLPAAARARTRPRFANDTFWDRLDTEPVGRPFPPDVTRADLAHAHLQALREELGGAPPQTVLAVPGYWGAGALGLLLSVARAAGFPVVGLVDAAVAAASLGHPGEVLLHLDLTRHRSIVTELVQADEVVRTRVVASDRVGWRVLVEAWAETIAAQFVRETRFDPLHAGDTEQALHDALPAWLDELCIRESLPVSLAASGREYRVELTRASLLAAAAVPCRGLIELVGRLAPAGEPAALLLSGRAGRIPGLAERLRGELGLVVEELTVAAAASGALAWRERLRHAGEALPFVTRLPSGLAAAGRGTAVAPAAPVPAVPGDGRPPTHVLNGAVAHAIGLGELAIGTGPPAGVRSLMLRDETGGVSPHHCSVVAADGGVTVEDRSGGDTFVNEERVEGRTTLRAGDRLRLGRSGRELMLITVSEAEG